MRIMLDTNVMISIVVFNSKTLGKMLTDICEKHTLVLSSYILEELANVIKIKFPDKAAAIDDILSNMPFKTELTPLVLPEHDFFTIRDAADEKILYSAISSNADVLITGDKDFENIGIERPEILTPIGFIEKYS